MSEILDLYQEQNSDKNIQTKSLSLPSDFHARIFQMLEKEQVLKVQEVIYFFKLLGLSGRLNPIFLSLKTSKVFFQATKERTLKQFSEQLPTLGFMSANGNCLIQSGYYPKIESEYTLLDIIEKEVSQEYFLSEKQIFYLFNQRDKPKLLDV